MSDFNIWATFIMFITIYSSNFKSFVCLCFTVYEIMQLFLNDLVFILDSNPDFVHYCRFPLVSYFYIVSGLSWLWSVWERFDEDNSAIIGVFASQHLID